MYGLAEAGYDALKGTTTGLAGGTINVVISRIPVRDGKAC